MDYSYNERRGSLTPIPVDLEEYMSIEQRATYWTLQRFGWTILFVRRSEGEITLVLTGPGVGDLAVLEADGALNKCEPLPMRPLVNGSVTTLQDPA